MLKNFLFYAFSEFINTWTAEQGGGAVFRVFGIVSLAMLATCIPMCKFPTASAIHFIIVAPSRGLGCLSVTFLDIFGKLNRKMMNQLYTRHRLFKALA